MIGKLPICPRSSPVAPLGSGFVFFFPQRGRLDKALKPSSDVHFPAVPRPTLRDGLRLDGSTRTSSPGNTWGRLERHPLPRLTRNSAPLGWTACLAADRAGAGLLTPLAPWPSPSVWGTNYTVAPGALTVPELWPARSSPSHQDPGRGEGSGSRAWLNFSPGWLLPRQRGRCAQVVHRASLLTAHTPTDIWGRRTESRGSSTQSAPWRIQSVE